VLDIRGSGKLVECEAGSSPTEETGRKAYENIKEPDQIAPKNRSLNLDNYECITAQGTHLRGLTPSLDPGQRTEDDSSRWDCSLTAATPEFKGDALSSKIGSPLTLLPVPRRAGGRIVKD